MTKRRALFAVVFVVAVLMAGAFAAAQDKPADTAAAPAGPRPIGLQDILAWKSIGSAELSPDGSWFMYKLSPLEGESEIVLRQVEGTKEYRFPIGEAPRFGGPRTGFSADSKWAAFLSYPGSKDMKALRKDKKRVMTTAVLVDLATGDKIEYEKIRSLAFSGENPGLSALHVRPRKPGEGEGQMDGLRPRPPRAGHGQGAQSSATSPSSPSTSTARGWPSSSTPTARPGTASSSATWPPARSSRSTTTRPPTRA